MGMKSRTIQSRKETDSDEYIKNFLEAGVVGDGGIYSRRHPKDPGFCSATPKPPERDLGEKKVDIGKGMKP